MFRQIIRSKLFMRTFIYYNIILIIPIFIFSLISYNYNIQEIKSNTLIKCNRNAENVTSLIDDQLKSIHSLSGRIDMLSWVWKLNADSNIPYDGFTAIQKKNIINDLKIFITDYSLVRDMILLFPKKEVAISSSGWFDIESYFNYLGNNERIQKIKDGLKNHYDYTVLYSDGLIIKNHPVLWLINSIDKITEPRAQAVFLIDKNKIEQFIRSISPDTLYKVEIYTQQGESIIQVQNHDILKDKNMLFFTIPSSSFGWTYHLSFDTSFGQEWRNALLFLIIVWLCSIIIEPIIAFLLAYVSYYPLKRMMGRIMPDNIKYLGKEKLNEYNILENAFTRLRRDNKEMYKKIKEYGKYAQNDMLVRLLKGYFYKKNNEDLAYYGIDYCEENKFVVLIISVSEIDETREDRFNKIMMARLLSEKRLKDKSFNYKIIDMLEEDIVIILSDGKKELKNNYINEFLDELRRAFENINADEIQIWCGNIEQGYIGISKSYQSAKEARELGRFVQDINENADVIKNFYYPTDWEVQLINNLKIGKEETVMNIIDAIKSENEKRALDTNAQYILYDTIKNTIMRVLAELNLTWSEEEIKDSISDCHKKNHIAPYNLEEREWMYIYSVCHKICSRITDKESKNADISDHILEYINKNYADSHISLKQMASEFGVSVSTISKAFKKKMGINFYDYLCRLRMERAKALLRKGGFTIKEISKMVGYENEFSFRRAFERYEGASVSYYRESIKI